MRKLTKLILALLTISLCLNGCKKNDYIKNTNEISKKETVEKYTKVPLFSYTISNRLLKY